MKKSLPLLLSQRPLIDPRSFQEIRAPFDRVAHEVAVIESSDLPPIEAQSQALEFDEQLNLFVNNTGPYIVSDSVADYWGKRFGISWRKWFASRPKAKIAEELNWRLMSTDFVLRVYLTTAPIPPWLPTSVATPEEPNKTLGFVRFMHSIRRPSNPTSQILRLLRKCLRSLGARANNFDIYLSRYNDNSFIRLLFPEQEVKGALGNMVPGVCIKHVESGLGLMTYAPYWFLECVENGMVRPTSRTKPYSFDYRASKEIGPKMLDGLLTVQCDLLKTADRAKFALSTPSTLSRGTARDALFKTTAFVHAGGRNSFLDLIMDEYDLLEEGSCLMESKALLATAKHLIPRLRYHLERSAYRISEL